MLFFNEEEIITTHENKKSPKINENNLCVVEGTPFKQFLYIQ